MKTLKNVKWKYLAYALAYVAVVWLSQLLVVNPDTYLVLGILLPIALAVSIIVAIKFKSWIKRFTTFLTWLAISLGSVASGQLSRSIITLAPFTPSKYASGDWSGPVHCADCYDILFSRFV